jgi:hypothetical protein
MMSGDTSVLAMSPPVASVETPSSVVKRGRGRPRGSDKGKLFAQASRQKATTSLEEVETSDISVALEE